MRWIRFLILAYVLVLIQTTAVRVLTFHTTTVGSVGPDLLALLTVFVAFYVRTWEDAMLAGWVMGLCLDLTTAGGVGAVTAVGPMAVIYALAAGLLFRVREAFFREHALTQGLLAVVFCLLTHGTWVTAQALLMREGVTWASYGQTLLQAVALAVYTGLLMPLVHFALTLVRRWFLAAPVGAGMRSRR